jgi:hypothetical protein
VLLGIRTAIREQGYSSAQLLYGSNLELPVHYFIPTKPDLTSPTAEYLNRFFAMVRDFPKPKRQHHAPHFLPKDVERANHVWLREQLPKPSLSKRYSGPYEVLARDSKTVTLNLHGREDKVSIDRVKPAYLEADLEEPEDANALSFSKHDKTHASDAQASQPSTTQTNTLYDEGTVVYAKFRGYPPWPAVVVNANETPLQNRKIPKNGEAVRFFGTNRFAFIDRSAITAYQPKVTQHRGLKRAIEQAEDYLIGKAASREGRSNSVKAKRQVQISAQPIFHYFEREPNHWRRPRYIRY